ncbi:MAG: hypothetical protein H7228_04350 [Polaromonas sp.]|nr:hypothetical protein [Polaromonas sp.]
MTQQPSLPTDSDVSASPLAQALDMNEAVKDTVEQSAAELVMINAVLKQEIPDHVQTGDVAYALQRTDDLEAKINVTAQDLAQVNEVLAQEIDQRVDLERELAETKAALVEAQNNAEKN